MGEIRKASVPGFAGRLRIFSVVPCSAITPASNWRMPTVTIRLRSTPGWFRTKADQRKTVPPRLVRNYQDIALETLLPNMRPKSPLSIVDCLQGETQRTDFRRRYSEVGVVPAVDDARVLRLASRSMRWDRSNPGGLAMGCASETRRATQNRRARAGEGPRKCPAELRMAALSDS